MKKMLSVFCAAAIVAMSTAAIAAPGAGDNSPGSGVYGSVHDLTNGPALAGAPHAPRVPGFVADAQLRLCAYCHTPHHAIKVGDTEAGTADFLPLWSHAVSTVTYTPYLSATFTPKGGQTMQDDPLTGPSRLCMSCHDGLTAVDNYYGMTNGHPIAGTDPIFTNNPVISHNGNSNHPLGFVMTDVIPGMGGGNIDTNSVLALTASSRYVSGLDDTKVPLILDRLYQGSIMTCSSCHDVHNTLNKVSYQTGAANFLLLGTQKNSGICLSCHTQGGGDTGSAHTSVPGAAFTY
jgi:hypothetical protein